MCKKKQHLLSLKFGYEHGTWDFNDPCIIQRRIKIECNRFGWNMPCATSCWQTVIFTVQSIKSETVQKVYGIMNHFQYLHNLETMTLPSAKEHTDPRHSARIVEPWLEDKHYITFIAIELTQS